MGTILGGLLAIALITFIIDRFAFNDEEPDARAMKTVGSAYLICAVLSFVGLGPYAPLFYLPGAVVMLFWQRRTYHKAWSQD